MKKNFFKKLAFVLALVLTVTSLNYAPASAAKTPAWKATKSVISLQNTYRYAVKNVPSKGKVAWKIGNTKVAKISSKGNVRGVGAGTTTVKATVKNSKGKTVKTLTQKVTIKAPVWVATKDTLKEGERTNFTKQYTAKGAKVKWTSSNTEVARVSQKGSVLAVKAGKTTITATFTMNGDEYATLTKDVTVEAVETAIQSVSQNTSTKLTATFVGDTKDVKTANFSIIRSNDNAVMAVKNATVDSTDSSKVVIETYNDMKDGKEYTVTYKGTKESTAKFVATDGVVASLNVTPLTITFATSTDVKAQTLDANGVVINEYEYADTPSEVEFTIDTNNGYMDGKQLHLYEVGNTAKAKVVYHTFKYDDKGQETGKIEKEFIITAVKDSTTISNFNYTISDKAPNWEKSFEPKKSISLTDEKGKFVFFNFKDSNKKDVTDNYTVESGDTSKFLLDDTSDKISEGVKITPIAEGSGYILIKNKDKAVVASLPVTVTAKYKISNLVFDQTGFALANGGSASSKIVKVTAKNQIGEDLDLTSPVKVEFTKVPSKSSVPTKTENPAQVSINDNEITIDGTQFGSKDDAGSYTVKVSATYDDVTISRYFSFDIKDYNTLIRDGNFSYKVVFTVDGKEMTGNKVDMKVADDAKAGTGTKEVVVKVAKTASNNRVILDYVSTSSIKVTNPKGKTEQLPADTNAIVLSKLTNGTATGSAIKKVADVGNFKVEVKFDRPEKNKDGDITATFAVTDTQPKATVTVTKVTGSDVKSMLTDNDYVTFYYDGQKIDGDDVEFYNYDDSIVEAGDTTRVKTINLIVNASDDVKVIVPVDVNRTFYVK